MNELALFAGAGLGLLGTHLLGWCCIGYVEKEEYPCRVLEARINDGLLSKAPIYQMHTRDFIKSGIAASYRGLVDVITAGFPCSPFSRAGLRLGEQDERNGWPDTIAIIRLVRPCFVLLENVPALISSKYFGTILGDLAASGYDCRWDCIPASAIGANHQRDRLWIIGYVANANHRAVSHPHGDRCGQVEQQDSRGAPAKGALSQTWQPGWWQVEPRVGRVVDGCPARVDRLKALGNGQVPAVAKAVWRLLGSPEK